MWQTSQKFSAYDWMLALSPEGWAWEFLRRNSEYRQDFTTHGHIISAVSLDIAKRWGLLRLEDPATDARNAIVFWSPLHNGAVLSLVTTDDRTSNGLYDVRCKVTVMESLSGPTRHVLYSCNGRYLQLAVAGDGPIDRTRFLMDVPPEHGGDLQILALRRLSDLRRHKKLRPHLYRRQHRAARLAHIAEILDSYARNPAHRAIAQDVFGSERTKEDWDNVRDHIRRAVAAGQKLTQSGYLEFLR